MFVDASAWTAILLKEPEAEAFRVKLSDAVESLTSAMANWEAARAIARETSATITEAMLDLAELQAVAGTRLVMIGVAEQDGALLAHLRFGKGVHPAKLNMGDCFAYACAKVQGVPLLYKGDDFSQTDIETA
jgi:ribonuclease VapC